MKALIKRSFFVLAATTLGMTTLRAQTADDIVNKYIAAIGGKDALNSVHSLIIEATTSVAGNDGDTQDTIVFGKGYKNHSDFGGTTLVTCITPNGGWTINPFMGANTPTAIPEEQLKSQQINLTLDPLANYAANGNKIELAGQDTADYKIKVSGKGPDVTYYVNAKTYLIDKVTTHMSMGGQDADVNISFSDYRKLPDAGLMYPYSETLDLPQASLVITIKKVTVNPTVDPSVFDMPKQ
ncbi:MAG TPA: hypothetical protein VGR89_13465 [Puia sp.]|nr:hypothetical protein [Puia sp.]